MEHEYSEFKAYCKIIADKIKEYRKTPDFLDHFAKNMRETVDMCLSRNFPHKAKLVSLVNFAFIACFILEDDIIFEDCLKVMEEYHTRSNVFSVGRNGEVKNA